MSHLRLDAPCHRMASIGWRCLPIAVALLLSAGARAADPIEPVWPGRSTATAPRGPARPSNEVARGAIWRGQDQESVLLPGLPVPSLPDPAPDEKFPTDDDAPKPPPKGGVWTLLDPKFDGPDGEPGFVPWLSTFFTARTLPGFEPDIKDPGPDSANFPNSAFTIPQGEVYIETSPITFQKTPFFNRKRQEQKSDQYSLPTLLRFGVLHNFELRLWSQTFQTETLGTQSVSGFGPLLFDSKFHFWDQDKEAHIPAFGVQLMVLTNLGTPAFSVPQLEPQFSLNFDYELENGINLEWNIGGTWAASPTQGRVYQANFQWSIQKEVVKNVDGFVHGYFNTPQSTRFREGAVVGAGAIWYATKRAAFDASYSFAVMPGSPDPIIRLGLSLAL